MQYSLIFARLFATFQYVAPKSSHQQGSKPLASDLAHSQKEPALSVPMPSRSTGPNFGNFWPKTAQDGSKSAQDAPKTAQDSRKSAQDASKTASQRSTRARRRPNNAPRGSNMASRRPTRPPRRPKRPPRGPARGKNRAIPFVKRTFLAYSLFDLCSA